MAFVCQLGLTCKNSINISSEDSLFKGKRENESVKFHGIQAGMKQYGFVGLYKCDYDFNNKKVLQPPLNKNKYINK